MNDTISVVKMAVAQIGTVPDEQRLYLDLMYDYESSVRPVMNASKIIEISLRLSLNQIVDLVGTDNLVAIIRLPFPYLH